MAQNENYSQVDLRVGTEEQFNAKVGTLPAGTLFGTTDSTVSKADLSTDLKNEINGKINKPANPTSDSAVVINSSGTVSTKPLTSITGKAEVAVSSTTPLNDEILWINPNGTSGGGSSSGTKLYMHNITVVDTSIGGYDQFHCNIISEKNTEYTYEEFNNIVNTKKGIFFDAWYEHQESSNIPSGYAVWKENCSVNVNKLNISYYEAYPYSVATALSFEFPNTTTLQDTVTEL